eukprot:1968809-Amphidinium_carterae.1
MLDLHTHALDPYGCRLSSQRRRADLTKQRNSNTRTGHTAGSLRTHKYGSDMAHEGRTFKAVCFVPGHGRWAGLAAGTACADAAIQAAAVDAEGLWSAMLSMFASALLAF